MKILFVDDDTDIAWINADTFARKFGHETDFETHPERVLEKVRIFKPDIVVSDIQMPNKNGFDLCKQIKKEFPQLPVLFLTALSYPEVCLKACGAIKYIDKGKIEAKELNHELSKFSEIDNGKNINNLPNGHP
jgi:CheY-like chemotaxis protein